MTDEDKLPLRDFRAELPLTDADLAAIRAGVMAKIAAPKRSFFMALGWWPAVAATAVLIIGFTAILLLRQPSVPAPPIPVARPARPARPAPETVASTQPAERALPAEPAPPPPVQHSHVVRQHHRVRRTPTRPVLVAAAPPRVIQLQTSDPNIRIIWITR